MKQAPSVVESPAIVESSIGLIKSSWSKVIERYAYGVMDERVLSFVFNFGACLVSEYFG
jgi:hypothetical protein